MRPLILTALLLAGCGTQTPMESCGSEHIPGGHCIPVEEQYGWTRIHQGGPGCFDVMVYWGPAGGVAVYCADGDELLEGCE